MVRERDLSRVAFLLAKGYRLGPVEGTGVNVEFTFSDVTPADAATLYATEEFAICSAFRRGWVQARRAIEAINGRGLQ
jgi:hypothetical protein